MGGYGSESLTRRWMTAERSSASEPTKYTPADHHAMVGISNPLQLQNPIMAVRGQNARKDAQDDVELRHSLNGLRWLLHPNTGPRTATEATALCA